MPSDSDGPFQHVSGCVRQHQETAENHKAMYLLIKTTYTGVTL